MTERDDLQDQQLDALLNGSLTDADARLLRQRLRQADSRDTQVLAPLLPRVEKVPPALARRIRRLPAQQPYSRPSLLRWTEAVSVAAVVTLSVLVLYQAGNRQHAPSPREVEQAREELLVAFSYLEQIGQRTGLRISHEIGDTMSENLLKGVAIGVNNLPDNG